MSGFSLNSNVVSVGKSCLFSINSDASTFSSSRILISFPTGLFVSASDLFTTTFTVMTLVAPFSNVTLTFPMYFPDLFVFIASFSVMSVTFAPVGKFVMLSVKSYVSPNPTISSIASTVGIGVMIAACFCTIIFDCTLSIEPSEYFTIIVSSNFPAVFVSGFSLNSNVVSVGIASEFATKSFASTLSPSRIFISLPIGSLTDACVFVAFAIISTEFSIFSPGLTVQFIGDL